jgi:acetylxylan esterase
MLRFVTSPPRASLATTLGRRIAMPLAIACGVLVPASARAAALAGPIAGWSKGAPSYISMYEYVPSSVVASPPIVVASHYCGGSASAFFSFASRIVSEADKYGFIMIFPQTTNPATSKDCWDVGSPASLTHDGGGDTEAIVDMVQYEIAKRSANANRVYAMGSSSGAMMTEALLAVYPDVFKAGAEFSGVPAGCWAVGWMASSNWSSQCATGSVTKTAQQWGDLVRAMYPGYSGFRPRIQLWHGTADATINYNNQTEAIKEWTNVLGLSATPDSTDTTSTAGYTIEKWEDSCALVVLEAHTQADGGHTTPINATSVIGFFGLDKTGPDPQIAACDAGGSSGSSGSAGQDATSGGASSGAGSADSGASSGSGGGSSGGTSGNGATSGSSGGTSGNGATAGTSSGGIDGDGGSAGGDRPPAGAGDPDAGCSCKVGSASGPGRSAGEWLLVAAVTLLCRRRTRRARQSWCG